MRRGLRRPPAVRDPVYRAIFEHTGTATVIMEADTTIALVNGEAERISGFDRRQMEGRMSWTELVVDRDLERMLRYHRLRRQDPALAPRNYECRVRTRNGKVRTCFLTVGMIAGTDQSIASLMDITERRQLERRVLAVQQLERRRISGDLHDDLGAHLAGTEAMAAALCRRLDAEGSAAAALAAEIRDLVAQALAKTRRLSRGLWPVSLEQAGLGAALADLAEQTGRRFSLDCRYQGPAEVDLGDRLAATNLYFIAQEAVANAARHGRAGSVVIGLEPTADGLTLWVRDDGKGFDPGAANQGLGLATMGYRARMLGAELQLQAAEGRGCTVQCRFNPRSSS